MNQPHYKLIFTGQFLHGIEPAQAQRAFASNFNIGDEQLRNIFTGKPVLLKQHLDHVSAMAAIQRLSAIGLRCQMVQVAHDNPSPDAPDITTPLNHPNRQASTVVSEATVTRSRVYTNEEIDQAFGGDEFQVRTGFGYRLGLLAVAVAMLMLPLCYLALVSLTAYGVYWHITSNYSMLMMLGYGKLGLLLYAVPILAGGALTLFLLKPFIARYAPRRFPIQLDRIHQRALFHLVEQISRRVGAPVPAAIHLDSHVNASASLRHGLFSNRLTLTIGMPLFLGLNVQALSGVLAHEFGHFAQPVGMRLRYIIETVNQWFYRRVNETDSWDKRIEQWQQSTHTVLVVSGMVAGYGMALSRVLLTVLMSLGLRISRYMSRQMEFDADQYEIGLVGSNQFIDTAVRLRELAAGQQLGLDLLQRGWNEGKLADNLPALGVRFAGQFDADTRARIAADIESVNSDPLDTHPPDLQRIDAARRQAAEGIMRHAGPASRLLYNLDALCRKVSFAWYRDQDLKFCADDLVPLSEFTENVAHVDERNEVLERVFGVSFCSDRVLAFPDINRLQAADPVQLASAAQRFADQWRAAAANAGRVAQRRNALLHRILNLRIARALVQGNVAIEESEFDLVSCEPEAVEGELAGAAAELAELDKSMDRIGNAQATWLATTLALACAQGRCSGQELTLPLTALRALRPLSGEILSLESLGHELRTLGTIADHAPDATLGTSITVGLRECDAAVDRIVLSLRDIRNPAQPSRSLADVITEWAGDRAGASTDPMAASSVAIGTANGLRYLNTRATADLAELAERTAAQDRGQAEAG